MATVGYPCILKALACITIYIFFTNLFLSKPVSLKLCSYTTKLQQQICFD